MCLCAAADYIHLQHLVPTQDVVWCSIVQKSWWEVGVESNTNKLLDTSVNICNLKQHYVIFSPEKLWVRQIDPVFVQIMPLRGLFSWYNFSIWRVKNGMLCGINEVLHGRLLLFGEFVVLLPNEWRKRPCLQLLRNTAFIFAFLVCSVVI